MNIEKNFGQLIFKYRKLNNISQESLAGISDLDRTYISLLERGLRNPTLVTVFKLAKALKVLPSVLIKELEEKDNEF